LYAKYSAVDGYCVAVQYGAVTEIHIYKEEVERKGLGREVGLQLPAESFLENFHSFFKITVCYILTPRRTVLLP
jgi:hypothetical protein